LIILYLPVSLKIEYQREEEGDGFNLELYTFLELFGISIQIPYLKNRIFLFLSELISEIDYFFIIFRFSEANRELGDKIKQNNKQIENIKKAIFLLSDRELMGTVFRFLRIKCLKFYWETNYGATDPAYTAVLNGFIWTVKGIIIKICDDLMRFKRNVELFVKPDFYHLKLSTYFTGIFTTRLGNIIITIVNIILLKIIRTTINFSGFFPIKYR